MRAALLLVLVAVLVADCSSVVIIQRNVPTLADQWRPATTVTIPKDARQPITVKE